MKEFVIVPLSLRRKKDATIVEWLDRLPKRSRSSTIRRVIKKHLKTTVKYLIITGSLLTGTDLSFATEIDVKPIDDLGNMVFWTVVKIATGISLPLLGLVALKIIIGCNQSEERTKAKEMALYIIIGLLFLAAAPWLRDGFLRLMSIFPGFPKL